jgi:hypothetical protein
MNISTKPSFTAPRILSTRIATTETFRIIPFPWLEQLELLITGVPYHRDIPLHSLTRLVTMPTNQYRYIQICQRTLYPVLPVHTHACKFKLIINNKQYRLPGAAMKPHAPHEAWKDVDYDILIRAWNSDVEKQDHLPSHKTLDPTPGGTNRQDGPQRIHQNVSTTRFPDNSKATTKPILSSTLLVQPC